MTTLGGMAIQVTGGGTGIGRAIAARLVADGANVTICGRTEARLTEARDELRGQVAQGGSVDYVVADVTQESDVAAAVERATAAVGRLDGCVANAGGGGMLAPLADHDTAEFVRVLHLNVLGTFLCLKHALPAMTGGGSFVAISSIAGHLTHPYFGAYPAAKAGVEQLVRNAADEYGAAGVRCNAVRPGFVATEAMAFLPRDGDIVDSYLRNIPLVRLGEPADVAGLVRFLLGPDAAWLTGTVIDLDGGHSLRRGPDFSSLLPGRAAL